MLEKLQKKFSAELHGSLVHDQVYRILAPRNSFLRMALDLQFSHRRGQELQRAENSLVGTNP